MRILLVEENLCDADQIQSMLPNQFDVHHVDTVEEALDILSDVFDIIVLDLVLEDKIGLDAFFEIKKLATSPIIILTNADGEKLALSAVKEGAQDYILKDVGEQIICRAIKCAIERHARYAVKTVLKSEHFQRSLNDLQQIVANLKNFIDT